MVPPANRKYLNYFQNLCAYNGCNSYKCCPKTQNCCFCSSQSYPCIMQTRSLFRIPACTGCRPACKSMCNTINKKSGCEEDEEENFMESIMPFIRVLSETQKMKLRLLYQDTIVQAFEITPTSLPFLVKYSPVKDICAQDVEERFFWELIPYLKSLEPRTRIDVFTSFLSDLDRIYHEKEGRAFKDKSKNSESTISASKRNKRKSATSQSIKSESIAS